MSISSLHRRSLGRFSSKALFQISLIIQRSPIIQIEKTAFEKAYQKYFYEVEKELSRGPFKLSLGLLSEADSKTASTLQSNEPGQLSLEDADNAATSLIEQANSLPITDPNRNPSEKLFLVIKRPLFEFWEFPTIEYVDGSFETPLHKTLFSGAEPNFYVPGNAPFDFQQTANKVFRIPLFRRSTFELKLCCHFLP
ncbi:hypothetical protein DI09_67p40 [Mitosporidium daphniae]|uniref:Uncharacterized protein n=1 Tax=Mitosporidium daphniae TaxID=1485682 RepID=A0A098VS11_9MICR|nr:uncharacterized protein DI09_67p40 [Mitosporidium daphniae]KGG50516.1 hypothetical protein DI09_67p40 [Mitosporidium daphniae]|eukprot:XP_013236967.1 uncharacterized protein DI09_67p40 [Mitosporidium daphniae]